GPRIPLPRALTLDAPTAGLEAATARELATVLAERVIGRRSAAKDEAAVDAVRLGGERIAVAPQPRAVSPRQVSLRLELSGELEPSGAEAYQLELRGEKWRLAARTPRGLFYGIQTLAQWLLLHDGSAALPELMVRDAPLFPVRGVMLDVSRNKVPKLRTLFALVDRLAALKINHLQLYTEHTFAYAGHEEVWRQWSPLTAADVQALQTHCTRRFVELVPNQNSFGHFHRWLVHERYRPLAECPEGIEHPFSHEVEPFSLCPGDPGALELLADLYDQLLPNFSSPLLNVGLDETFDLGLGRSRQRVEQRGRGPVYLDFLLSVHRLVSARGRRMLFWGDIVHEHPELAASLPDDCVALNWGYEADHPFDRQCARFAEADVAHWVCPGTSSWNSFAGRATNALHNVARAARAGAEHGATGLLVTDWGDGGHLQPQAASGPGLLAAAAAAWSRAECDACDSDDAVNAARMAERLDLWWFDDPEPGLGAALLAMADYYRLATDRPQGPGPLNGSPLFHQLQHLGSTLEHRRFRSLSLHGVGQVADSAGLIGEGLEQRPAGPDRDDLRWVAAVCELTAEIAVYRLAAGRDRGVMAVDAAVRRRWSHRLDELERRRRRLWMQRNRIGGWHATSAVFERARRALA
ncbi:MAG: glycoside hydrolase, partial [Acidobacteria bacterium]